MDIGFILALGSVFGLFGSALALSCWWFGKVGYSWKRCVLIAAAFLGMMAFLIWTLAGAVAEDTKGQPATSLEPGTYYVHEFIWSDAQKEGFPSTTFILDQQPPAEFAEALDEPVHVGRELRMVELKIYEFKIELVCESNGYCDAVPGWYKVERVTSCTDIDGVCRTKLQFTRLTEKGH